MTSCWRRTQNFRSSVKTVLFRYGDFKAIGLYSDGDAAPWFYTNYSINTRRRWYDPDYRLAGHARFNRPCVPTRGNGGANPGYLSLADTAGNLWSNRLLPGASRASGRVSPDTGAGCGRDTAYDRKSPR